MAAMTPAAVEISEVLLGKHGPAVGTHGLAGNLRLRAADAPLGVLKVADGAVEIAPEGETAVTLAADTPSTLTQLLGGELHPIVARLQGRVEVDGDVAFAIRVLLGLRAGSPWTGLVPRT
jgi:hypothetical protein